MKSFIVTSLIGIASSSVCRSGSYNGACTSTMQTAPPNGPGIADPTATYTCGSSAAQDIALKSVVDNNSGFCCGGGTALSACDIDFSSVCEGTSTFLFASNAANIAMPGTTSDPITCQQLMMAIRDDTIAIDAAGTTFGDNAATMVCTNPANAVKAATLDGIMLATQCCGAGKRSRCFDPALSGSPSLCSTGTYDPKCDYSIEAQKTLTKLTSNFVKSATYTCGASAANDIAMDAITTAGTCCGSGANAASTCDIDFSSVCETTGTFAATSNAVGVFMPGTTSDPIKCQQLMMAIRDPAIPIAGTTFGENAATYAGGSSASDITKMMTLDAVVVISGCCGATKHSKFWTSPYNLAATSGSQSLCSEGAYSSACDLAIESTKAAGLLSSTFDKTATYATCATNIQNDIALDTLVNTANCCIKPDGSAGTSACGMDFSSVCETTGTFAATSNAVGVFMPGTTNVPITCAQLMVAIRDPTILIGSTPFGDNAATMDCTTPANAVKAAVLDGVMLATQCCGIGKRSKCYVPSDTGSNTLCLTGIYNPACDYTIEAQKTAGTLTSDFRKNSIYSCGLSAQNDLVLDSIVTGGSCCGANGKSACNIDYSSVCEATGTFAAASNAVGVFMPGTTSDPMTCQQLMMAISDPTIDISGSTFGLNPVDNLDCSDATKAIKSATLGKQ